MALHRSEIHKIHEWWRWVEICAEAEIDPYENVDCGYSLGGGGYISYEYTGDFPRKKDKEK